MSEEQAYRTLVSMLQEWSEMMSLPRLGDYAISEADIPLIVAHSRNNSMKTNPIVLTDDELTALIRVRI